MLVRNAIFAAPLLATFILAGCAGHAGTMFDDSDQTIVELTAVPFFPQESHQCGPAALATVLQASGVDVTPTQLAPETYVPRRLGTLQAELLGSARRHSRVPVVLPSSSDALPALLGQLRSGRPVLVLQNVGLRWWPVWHYAVVIGVDPARRQFLLRSGTNPRLTSDANTFVATWARAGHWAMVVAVPGDPPSGISAMHWLRAVAPLESIGRYDMASAGYEAAVQSWPDDTASWAALGNIRYLLRDLDAAEIAYRRALALDQNRDTHIARATHHNLGELMHEQQCRDAMNTTENPSENCATTK